MRTAEEKKPATAGRHTTPFFDRGSAEHFFGTRPEPDTFFQQASLPLIQPKLAIGQPNDKYEKEADAVAQKVVSSSEPAIQAKCAECEKEERLQKQSLPEEEELQMQPMEDEEDLLQTQSMEEEEDLQMKPSLQLANEATPAGRTEASPWIQSRINSSRGSGRPLDSTTRNFMEGRMQTDFSGVNVHAGDEAVQMNRELGARAFTVGSDIYFNKGEYRPETTEGKKLLAHELTHTVQQGVINETVQKEELQETGIKEHGDLSQVPSDMGDCPIAITSPENEGAVNYAISSYKLSPGVKESLTFFVNSWRDNGANAHIRIDGYASIDGKEAYNWQLSCNRAKALALELVDQGISSAYIDIYAHGETNRFSTHSYEPNRVATLTSTLPPPIPPKRDPKPKEQSNVCGPDITASLSSVLTDVDRYFHGLGSWWEKRRSCMALDVDAPIAFVNPFMAWDVRQLFLPATSWLDLYYVSSGCGSPRNAGCDTDPQRHLCEEAGTCGNSVVVGGRCMLAGTANYAIYGRMFKLCNDEFWPDFPRWDMRAMINMYKALSVLFDSDDPEPPREMATAVFDGAFPTIPSSAENRAHCKGRCGKTHSGGFGFVWEPYKPR